MRDRTTLSGPHGPDGGSGEGLPRATERWKNKRTGNRETGSGLHADILQAGRDRSPPETLGAHSAATFLPITNHSPDLGSR